MNHALRALAIAVPLAMVAMSSPANAHHSFAMFDPSKPMKFEATVQSLQWTAPHAVLWVEAGKIGTYDAGVW